MTEFFTCWKTKIGLFVGVFILSSFWPLDGEASELKDIRIGRYEHYTRVVFEFTGSTSLKSPVSVKEETLSLVFMDVTASTAFHPSSESINRIKSLDIIPSGNNLSVDMACHFRDITFDTFFLFSPHRFVVDIFQNSFPADEPEPVPAVSVPIIRVPENKSPEPSDLSNPLPIEATDTIKDVTPAKIKKNEAEKQKVEAAKKAPAAPSEIIKKPHYNAISPILKKNSGKDQYRLGLEKALYATTFMIVLLLAYLLYQRLKDSKPCDHSKSNGLPTVKDQRIKSIDDMIKEKLNFYNTV